MKLRANGIKLNPEKCIFGVPRGMLLGFIVSERGIEATLKKILAITRMGPIQNIKGGTMSYRVPHRAQPLYLVLWRMRYPPLSAPK